MNEIKEAQDQLFITIGEALKTNGSGSHNYECEAIKRGIIIKYFPDKDYRDDGENISVNLYSFNSLKKGYHWLLEMMEG